MTLSNRIVVFDIGARSGIDKIIPGWIATTRPIGLLRSFFDVYGFEPDPEELLRLKRTGQYKEVQEYAIAKDTGTVPLYITHDPGKSSILEPDIEVIENNFGGVSREYEINRIVSVPCRNLDDIAEEIGVFPDWIKIDTQGSEIGILEGAPKALEAASVLFLELSSIPQYKSQHTTIDALELLLSNNFDLLACNYKPIAPYENDFVFVRRVSDLSTERMLRSLSVCMTLLGMDQQAEVVLSKMKSDSFARTLRYKRRQASIARLIKAPIYRLPPRLRWKLKAFLGGLGFRGFYFVDR